MTEKKIVTKEELKILSTMVDDTTTKNILRETADLLEKYKVRKYLTKELKYSLMKLGFEYKEKYLNTNDAQDYVTRSKQIDIIDRKILRIGLGKDKLYTCRWLEVPVVL